MSEAPDLSGLKELSSCEISDALVKLGYTTGGHIGGMNLYSPVDESVRIVGPAFTVKLVKQEHEGEEVNKVQAPRAKEHFVDACPSGSIMVISAPFVHRAACWGGLMSTAAQAKGIKGAVIHGGCRDLAEHRELGFPVFAQFHSTLGQRSFLRPSQYDIPLSIPLGRSPDDADTESTTIEPGDIIVADLDGVVSIPRDRIGDVIRVANEGRAADENVRKDLAEGKGVKVTMAKWRG